MGRPIPSQSVTFFNTTITITLLHGILMLSVVYITLAFVFFLCGSRPRKSSLPPPSSPRKPSSAVQPKSSLPPSSSSSPKAVPLPPPSSSMIVANTKTNGDSGNVNINKDGAGGKRKLMVSLSQKLTRSWTLRREANRTRGKSASTTFDEGELIWKKQIILGERCRVPPIGGQDEDEIAVYDENGQKVAPYHPRTPRSLPVSRTTSAIDVSAINLP